MTTHDLLTAFRTLGGVADNVTIRLGEHGQGLYAIEPRQPIRLALPMSLLISPEWLQTTPDGQHVQVQAGRDLSVEVRAFHEQYQRSFGWGAGGGAYIHEHRAQLAALPAAVQHFLPIFGSTEDWHRPLTPLQAFQRHCVSRQIRVNGASRLMPVLELVNHDNSGAPYVTAPEGVSLSGTFAHEVKARYHHHLDAFHFFFNYHFATPGQSILSCEVHIDIPGFRALRIARRDGLSRNHEGLRIPQISTRQDEVQLSFLELVRQDHPALPRDVFLMLMAEQGMAARRAHTLFDGLLDHHRQVLQAFLQACDAAQGSAAQKLRQVARDQLAHLVAS